MKVSLNVVKANEFNSLLASQQSNRLYPPAIHFMMKKLRNSLKPIKDWKETKEVSEKASSNIKLKGPFDPQIPEKTFSQEVSVFDEGLAKEWCKW